MVEPNTGSILEALRRELETARARVATLALTEDDASASELLAHWVLTERAIVWWIETGEVREPDVDLEDLGAAIVVRVRRTGEPQLARVVLPVPADPPIAGIAIEFREGGLEVRLVLGTR